MYKNSILFLVLVLAALPFLCRHAAGGEPELVSSMGLEMAVSESGGFAVVPAKDVSLPLYTEDLSPPQALEIVRPSMGPVTIGRLVTSCSCLKATLTKKSYGQGERAILEVRNIKSTPKGGATFAVFVQITAPVAVMLQYDIFVNSGAAR